ncbi:MAG: hypothetical protein ACR2N2_02990 [Acidimicrobiia bacterium]
MTTDVQKETSDAPEALVDTTTAPDASDASAEVLAKARFEAFGLVTEARKEAESIIDEAREQAADIVKEAEMIAESIRDAARLEASEARAERHDTPAAEDSAEVTPETTAALEAEHQELEDRVGSLRDLADQLEDRFAQLAADSEPQVAPVATGTEDASDAPVLDYSPSVEPPAPEVEQTVGETDGEAEKGSFYSRRSAKLPRIGDEGGKSALDMMRSIRASLDDDA